MHLNRLLYAGSFQQQPDHEQLAVQLYSMRYEQSERSCEFSIPVSITHYNQGIAELFLSTSGRFYLDSFLDNTALELSHKTKTPTNANEADTSKLAGIKRGNGNGKSVTFRYPQLSETLQAGIS